MKNIFKLFVFLSAASLANSANAYEYCRYKKSIPRDKSKCKIGIVFKNGLSKYSDCPTKYKGGTLIAKSGSFAAGWETVNVNCDKYAAYKK